MSLFYKNAPELPIDPPEERISGYDWRGEELYGYEEGYYIDGEFVREDEIDEWMEENFQKTTAEEVFG